MRKLFLPCLSLASVMVIALVSKAIALPSYVFTNLGVPTEFSSHAYAINQIGQVVGDMSIDGSSSHYHAFVYTPGNGSTDIGTLGGYWSKAYGINDMGWIAGCSNLSSGPERAFLYTPDTGMADLGTLGGYHSWAYAINNSGQVVGSSYTRTSWPHNEHAFIYTPGVGMVDLGTLGGADSRALAVNDVGQVVGWSVTSTYYRHAFLYTPGIGMMDLGVFPDDDISCATDVNNAGKVVGNSSYGGIQPRAFLYTTQTGMTDLGTLPDDLFPVPGRASNYASAINDRGQIVGHCMKAISGAGWAYYYQRAFLIDPDAGMLFLGDLMADPGQRWTPLGPSAINDAGEIVGERRIYDQPGLGYNTRAFLLTSADSVIPITIDIKPDDSPNCVNPRSQGTLPVAILTDTSFDAAGVNPSSVLLAGIAPVRWSVQDVDGDGDSDLLFHFSTCDLPLNGDVAKVVLELTGETQSGQRFSGMDEVAIVGKVKE